MYARRLQLRNYGPIENLDIVCPFADDLPKPLVLVGENGSGKSLVLSHIVNGMLAAQQAVYPSTPEVEEGKVYKIRSPSYIKTGSEFFFSRVDFEEDTHVEELQLQRAKKEYPEAPSGISDTPASSLWKGMSSTETSFFSTNFNAETLGAVFRRNCLLYLPPNRFEDPAWLNKENLNAKAQPMRLRHLRGYTNRALTSYSPLRDNENWLFDLAYDSRVFELKTRDLVVPVTPSTGQEPTRVSLTAFRGFSGRATTIYEMVVQVVQAIIQRSNVRLGIGPRQDRVVSVLQDETVRVPNLFQLSSGEVSLLNMFLSILRDFDLCGAMFAKTEDVRGIVVVDEVDLHLHSVHQYEVLPGLVQMFPRVQFIVTTHSPLFVLGLRNTLTDSGFALYGLPQGCVLGPEEFTEFGRAYGVLKTTQTYVEDLKAYVERAVAPLLFVDGTTDVRYLKRARELLGWEGTVRNVEIRGSGGDSVLKKAWNTLKTLPVVDQVVVFLHDCDSDVAPAEKDNIYRRKIPYFQEHPIGKGIENLFSKATLERAMAHEPAFVDIVAKHEVTERGQCATVPERWRINEDEKGNLCDWLCENGTAADFSSFSVILDLLTEISGMVRAAGAEAVEESS